MSVSNATPMSSDTPRTNAAALSAPIPANAICPSESCPPQPVSTVTDTAHTAKREDLRVGQVARRLVHDQRQDRSRPTSPSAPTSCGMRRTHQISRRRSGTGGMPRRELEALAAGVVGSGCMRATSTSTTRNRMNCTRPVSFGKLNDEHLVEHRRRRSRRAPPAGTTPCDRRAPPSARAGACLRSDRHQFRRTPARGDEDRPRSPRGSRRSSRPRSTPSSG